MASTLPRATVSWLNSQSNDVVPLGLKASATVYPGCIVATDATGFAVNGATSATLKVWGILKAPASAGSPITNSGASGSIVIEVQQGVFGFDNAGADPVTIADIGALVYLVDNVTIARTSNSSARSVAGEMMGLDANGQVYVRLGQALQ